MLFLEWSDPAKEEVKKIYDWNIRNYSVGRARKILLSIKKITRKIPSQPYAHPQCKEIEKPSHEIRNALVERTYWIIYKIKIDRIIIVGIFHGAMNPETYKNLK